MESRDDFVLQLGKVQQIFLLGVVGDLGVYLFGFGESYVRVEGAPGYDVEVSVFKVEREATIFAAGPFFRCYANSCHALCKLLFHLVRVFCGGGATMWFLGLSSTLVLTLS